MDRQALDGGGVGGAGRGAVKLQNEQREADLKRGVRADPLVAAVLDKFPGAEIVSVNQPECAADAPEGDAARQ